MPGDAPMVSLVVPCRNERTHIGACLDSLLSSDYPAHRLEILVVDGMSDDGTREIIAERAQAEPRVRMLDNPARNTPAALNVGLAHARGSVFMRADAHTMFPATYVSDLVAWLERSEADGVGGVCETLPGASTTIARAIAIAMAHPFGVGNSYFRIGAREPRWVDTVPFGCYRREVFDRIGGFDEELLRNQDDEFNLRLLRQGGRLLLVPAVRSRYFARATLRNLALMFFQYGLFKPLVIRKVSAVMTIRQLVPAGFTLSLAASALLTPWVRGGWVLLAGIALLYALGAVVSALPVVRLHGIRCALALLAVFPVIHLSYGTGFLVGLVRPGRHSRGESAAAAALPLSR